MNKALITGAGFFLLVSLFALNACRENAKIEGDEALIPRQEMVMLMSDMEVAEAVLRYKQGKISRDSLNKLSAMTFDSLYAWHQVTPARFKANLAYYQKDLAGFEKMLDEVILVLTRAKDSINNLPLPGGDTVRQSKIQVR
ncbi:hypothetical protein TBC1_111738 [Lentimicrobium saccharophilum]|uniref:DUF4296 domain-containing protein n=1 Tax=Lentimicrobium saccharophilum TaxID=1678841 RepID=A0A0S7C0N4_9BACT|nr:DUF4296 domain-containing protein [Lentimicrobium saccharophilum]GAP43582.1 hypothetical protein TBC1_111738 [Lentimicrobium saccharophilum]